MMDFTFSFICCYNDEEQLRNMLLPSLCILEKQNGKKYSHILIDNRNREYASAAKVFNQIITQKEDSLGDIVAFCHQDISFKNTDLWDHAEQELKKDPLQILGVAGIAKTGVVISNLRYLKSDKYITRTQTMRKIQVESLDECCFIIPKKLLKKLTFDEKVCSAWHLYAVDYCYAAHAIYGINSYVLPGSIYHKKDGGSGQNIDYSFLKSLWKICRKYSSVTSTIYAPCYIIKTSPAKALARIMQTFFKIAIRINK